MLTVSRLPQAKLVLTTSVNSASKPLITKSAMTAIPSGMRAVSDIPAASLRATYLKTASQPGVRFGNLPSQTELNGILQGLKGFSNSPRLFGSNFMPDTSVTQALSVYLLKKIPLPSAVLTTLMSQKLVAMNTQLLALGRPLMTSAQAMTDTAQFMQDVRRRMDQFEDSILNPSKGFSPAAREAFGQYAAQVLPVLFTMGFAESVDHSFDVAQVAMKMAGKLSEKKGLPKEQRESQMLMAAMVGLLHDPKLRGDLSWSNLATHPAVASAVAQEVFQQPNVKAALQSFLDESKVLTFDTFRQGVQNAVASNNDSKFVLDNVILKKFPFHPLAETGIAEGVPEAAAVLTERFLAPSQGKVAPAIPVALEEPLSKVHLVTDLRGIQLDEVTAELPDLTLKGARDFLLQVVTGQVAEADPKLITLRQTLKSKPQAVISPKVSGLGLSAHHEEAGPGHIASLALVYADSMLLSWHKIVQAPTNKTPLAAGISFNQSFEANLRYLPQVFTADAQLSREKQEWHRDMLASVVRTADELTGNSTLQAFEEKWMDKPLDDQVRELKQLAEAPTTWRNGSINFADFDKQDPANTVKTNLLIEALRRNYESAAAQSVAIFG